MIKKKLFVFMLSFTLVSTILAQNNNENFWNAAKTNNVETLKTLLEKGVDVNVTTEYGATALTYAADKGNLEATVFLLENGADPNMKDLFYQSTPFHWVLYSNNMDIIKSMIKHGADVNSPNALSWAASSGDIEIIKLMIENGSKGASQFLYEAVKKNQSDLAKQILELTEVNQEDLTSCLLLATALENKEAISVLEKVGAQLPEKTENNENLNNYTGYFENEEGNADLLIIDNLLAINFGTRPYKLIHKEKLIFTFLEYPDLTISFYTAGNHVISLEFKQGDRIDKFIKVEKPEIADVKEPEKKTIVNDKAGEIKDAINWPSFRGEQASGIADGQYPPTVWNINDKSNLKWKTYIPGLAHACPIIWEDKMYVITAIGSDSTSEYRVGLYGDVAPVDDNSNHVWKIYCLDKNSGEINWEKKAYEGVPRVQRHTKATQANSSPATNGKYVVALYGSEGLVCYDMAGNEQWRKDLGLLDAGWFFDEATQWGHSSSPIIYKNTVIVQVDRSENSYIAAYDLTSGNKVWHTERSEISSWGTPTIYYGEKRNELITNATKGIRGYNPDTGEELWTLGPNSEVTVATPVVYDDLIYVTAGYPPVRPVYAIKPGGNGDISILDSLDSGEFIQWRNTRGGTYMPSPIAYNGYLYTLANNGLLTCYDAYTGEQKYRQRINGGAFTASIVAADGKLYCTSEEKGIFVIKAGPEYELITSNLIGEICMATPAISGGMIFVRGQHHIFCIGR